MKLQTEKVVLPRIISNVRNALTQEMMKDKKPKEVFSQEENTIVTDSSKDKAPSPASHNNHGSRPKNHLEIIFWVVFLFLLGVIAGILFLT